MKAITLYALTMLASVCPCLSMQAMEQKKNYNNITIKETSVVNYFKDQLNLITEELIEPKLHNFAKMNLKAMLEFPGLNATNVFVNFDTNEFKVGEGAWKKVGSAFSKEGDVEETLSEEEISELSVAICMYEIDETLIENFIKKHGYEKLHKSPSFLMEAESCKRCGLNINLIKKLMNVFKKVE